MRIVIAGGTGFIGKALVHALAEREHEVFILTRSAENRSRTNPRLHYVAWDLFRIGGNWEREIDGAEAVINLAGESLVAKPWTAAQKKILLESRVKSVKAIHRAIEKASHRPQVLLNASAIGYYGDRGDEILDENSNPGTGFLAETCRQWEEEVMNAESLGVRTVRLRIGLALEKNGGALAKMLPAFRLGLGGPLGNGRQWMSWIYLADLVALMVFLLEHPQACGAFNATALNPVKMNDFAKALGKVLGRPALFRVPGFVLKVLLGELSQVLLTGQCVLPQRAIQLGFSFQHPTLESALRAILSERPRV